MLHDLLAINFNCITKDIMLEREIEKKVCDYAKSKGIYNKKFVSPSNRGVPDRMWLNKSHVYFIEFKRLNENLTVLQDLRRTEILANGGNYILVDAVDTGKKLVDLIVSNELPDLSKLHTFLQYIDEKDNRMNLEKKGGF